MSIDLHVADGIATVTLNRPEVRNAIDKFHADEMKRIIEEVDARDDVTVAILTGAHGFFCAGMDLKAISAGGERPINDRGAFGIAARPPEKPYLAAVEGKALGGGLEIALACDCIVAASDAQFGLPEVKRGMVAAAGGLTRLPRRIPPNIAMELAITGSPITADRAAELGLVNRISAPGQALEEALELGRLVASNAPLAVRVAKQVIVEQADWGVSELLDRQQPIVQPVRDSDDAKEGVRAFVEKREPNWQGR